MVRGTRKIEKENLIEVIRHSDEKLYDKLVTLKELLNISIEEAIKLYRENIEDLTDKEVRDAELEDFMWSQPDDGTVDELGCPCFPVADEVWEREEVKD